MDSLNEFKKAVLESIPLARKNGEITLSEALKLRLAMNNPKIVNKAYSIASDQYHSENPEFNGKIDWSSIKDFVIAVFPLILQLLTGLHVI
jgi:hypothetical protein